MATPTAWARKTATTTTTGAAATTTAMTRCEIMDDVNRGATTVATHQQQRRQWRRQQWQRWQWLRQ
eukprot:7454848-Alexandrium_andersonii.AAC.1